MTTETRYFKKADIDNNGLSCLEFGTAQSASNDKRSIYNINTGTFVWGIRVWKRSAEGVETEITSGEPVAQVSRSTGGEGQQNNDWACPKTLLNSGDSIVVRVYCKYTGIGTSGWVLLDTWQTADFNAGELTAATWTVYYYTKWWYGAGPDLWDYWGDFYFGDSTYNSRIENFVWTQYSQMQGPAASLRIYKQGAVATPKSVEITFRLRDLDDNPLSGKTIQFSTSLGSVSPSSDETDIDGYASTTLTSGSTIGWAVVKGYYDGLAGAGASSTYVEVAIYDDADSGDSSKKYQVFVQGIPCKFVSGNYKRVADFEPQQFSVELDQVYTSLIGAFEIVIYKRGQKDFVGRVRKIKLTLDDHMILSGVSNHWKLARRIAKKTYTGKDPKEILEDVLVRYPAGVSIGDISTYGTAMTLDFDYDNLLVILRRLLDITGWQARLNLDDSLDFAPSFGSSSSVSFATGDKNVHLEREIDYAPVDTRTFLIGATLDLVSDREDTSAEATQGLIEEAFFDKNITDQTILDLQNQKILDARKNAVERIAGGVIDLAYAADAYGVFDQVTVSDEKTGLSGSYKVVALARDILDHGYAEIELTNQALESQDLLAKVARSVKDLSVS
jgi:hypothetical protein